MTEHSENSPAVPTAVRSAVTRSAKAKKGPVAPASRALAAGLSVAATCAIIATFALGAPAQGSASQVVLDVSSSGVVGDATTTPAGSPATAPVTSAEIPVGTVPGSSVPGGTSAGSVASTGTAKSGTTATAAGSAPATPATAAPAPTTPAPAPVTAAPTTQAPRPTTPPTTARTRAS